MGWWAVRLADPSERGFVEVEERTSKMKARPLSLAGFATCNKTLGVESDLWGPV